jgi:hypothetical protein
MELFIDKEKREYLKFDIYYFESKIKDSDQKRITFFHKKNEKLFGDLGEKLKKMKIRMLIPDAEEHGNAIEKAVEQSDTGNSFINYPKYQRNIIKTLLKKIITDDYELEINEENSGSLNHLLAAEIFKGFELNYLYPEIEPEDVI